ncbi:MAG: hypothetical protein EZS28_020362, partial [Streblomastix strix]
MRRCQCPSCGRSGVETIGICLLCGRVICISDKCCSHKTREIHTQTETKQGINEQSSSGEAVEVVQVNIQQTIITSNELEIGDSGSGMMVPFGIKSSPLEEVKHSLQCCGMILPA